MCSAFFLRVGYVGSSLIERGVPCERALVSSGGLCGIFAYRTGHTP